MPNDAKPATATETKNVANVAKDPIASGVARKARERKPRVMVRVTQELPPKWEPKNDGEKLEGFFIKSQEITAKKRKFLIHIIQSEETGELQSFAGAVADRLFAPVPRGTYVCVTFVGWESSADGNDMRMFELDVEQGTELLEVADA